MEGRTISKMSAKILLIVDADAVMRASLKKFFENHNYKVCEAGTAREVVKQDFSSYSAIICDDKQIEIVRVATDLPVIVTSSHASLRSAVTAMKLGAADYLAKPFDFEELHSTINELTFNSGPVQQVQMLGNCPEIKSLQDKVNRIAPTDTNILLDGESGTGKELVARKIHHLSKRADRQMISLNCAAIPAAVIETELVGSEVSAPGDETTEKAGLFEAAAGSTLFLNEIGELSLDAQARLLRILQECEKRRISSVETREASTRLIASTNRDLERLVKEGGFRKELYFRLNGVKLSLPPLRERADDVVLIARHFLAKNTQKHSKAKLKFGEAALNSMKQHAWPGNVRELENAVERAVIFCDKKTITAELLALEPRAKNGVKYSISDDSALSLENYFLRFVTDNQDQMTETEIAKKLGISRKALWQRRRRLGIPKSRGKTA